MDKIQRLVFHIGVPKTGSSLIQKALRNLRPQLRDRGVTYVDRNVFLAIPDYRAWGSYGREGSKTDFLAAFAAQVERKRHIGEGDPTPTVLISNEAASGRSRNLGVPFWPGARPGITEIVELLDPVTTDVLVYVRRQDRLLESLYMQRIHRGAVVPWATHRDSTCLDDRVRYTELLDSITGIPSVDSIRVRPFEIIGAGAPAFVADFLSIVDAADLLQQLGRRKLAPTNPSFTQTAWEAAMAINPLLDRDGQPKQVRKFLGELFPSDQYPKAQLLTDEERAALIERYRPDNERFFREHLPEFPADTYSTIDGTLPLRNALTPIELPVEPPPRPQKLSLYRRVRSALGAMKRELRGSR